MLPYYNNKSKYEEESVAGREATLHPGPVKRQAPLAQEVRRT
jgi:aspartate carbamoyltransferase catalytic subunit